MSLKPPTSPTPGEPNPDSAVFTLDDLRDWSYRGTSLAVLGSPVAHSISPAMHNAALARMAATAPGFARWRYFKFDVPPDRLSEALPLLHEHGFRGVNLTIPHKTEVLSLLTHIDPAALRMGAVNTLLWTPDGYEGFNTDGYGLTTAVAGELGIRLASRPVILIGAGGAARAAAVQCLLERCPQLWLGNRNPDRLKSLHRHLQRLKPGNTRLECFDLKAPPSGLPASSLLVNATSLGLAPDDPAPFDPRELPPRCAVYDMIYPGPGRPESALLREARALGIPAAHGLSMLVHQGARSLEIWSGAPVPVETMRAAAEQALVLRG